MANRKTPLIKALRHLGDNYSSGGTMYVFPSASEDIGLNLNSNVNGVALSHYALLNIPPLPNSAYTESPIVSNTAEGAAKAIAISLQNYMMNFETLLLNDENYNLADLNTVTEKVFWHWAKKVGIINIKNYDKVEGYENIYYDKKFNADHNRFQQDETVVKCFGSIDAGNSLSSDFGMFNETYINIPTSYGAGPVFFKSSYDNNYRSKQYRSANGGTALEGRDYDTQYNSYLGDEDPMYDGNNGYNTVSSVANGPDGLEIVKDIDTLQRIARRHFSQLDGAAKDTDANINISSYDDINVDINNIFNIDTEFEFNAILLYYSIYNQDDNIKTPQATNLFGIIFLDSPRISNTEDDTFQIPTFKKVKSTSERFGNSYSFRVNIKTLSVYDNTDAIIQDNTTMSSMASMDFSDVIYQLNRAIDIMNTNVNATQKITSQYNSIISFYDSQTQKIDDISTALHSYLNGTHTAFLDTSTLFVNTIKVNSKNTSNNLEFYVINVSDNTEDLYYGNPIMTIDSSGTHTDYLYTDTIYNSKNFVIEQDTTPTDEFVLTEPNTVTAYTNVLDLLFNTSTNLVVKVKQDNNYSIENEIYHQKIYNQFYVSNKSKIFEKAADDAANINYLLDNNGINYAGLVPMLIAQIQRMCIDISTLKAEVETLKNNE